MRVLLFKKELSKAKPPGIVILPFGYMNLRNARAEGCHLMIQNRELSE